MATPPARPPRLVESPTLFRSERVAAVLLLVAAVVGLALANSPIGPGLQQLRDLHLGPAAIGLDLSLGHWITDGLLAIFFFVAALELRHELTHGELDSPRKAFIPAVAAIGGVVVPALIYLLIAGGSEHANGWPIPTATDIAFALGVLALVGRGLPPRVRALLLALAVIDDLIAILLIAFLFTDDVQPIALLLAVPTVLLFGWLSRRLGTGRRRAVIIAVLIAIGLLTWVLVHASGVHATIAGVALGLVMAPRRGQWVRHALEPWTNGAILPLFAFTSALVVVPAVGLTGLDPAFWGIVVALPLGKLIGITGAAMLASRMIPAAERKAALPLGDVVVVAVLGGIGFTVSLLMNELAFRGEESIIAEGTLAVLAGSTISIVAGLVVTGLQARRTRARHAG